MQVVRRVEELFKTSSDVLSKAGKAEEAAKIYREGLSKIEDLAV